MTFANFTPAVKRASDDIRRIVSNLTTAELIALREALEAHGENPDALGVREPREPRPSLDEDAIAVDPEQERKS